MVLRNLMKRKRVLLVVGVLASSIPSCLVQGFVSVSPISRTNVQQHETSVLTTTNKNLLLTTTQQQYGSYNNNNLRMVRTSVQTKTQRLTHEEQYELLMKAVEMRRINIIKSDLAIQSGKVSVLKIHLAKATGYGDEIDLLEQALIDGEYAREILLTGNIGLVHYCVNDILRHRRSTSSSNNNQYQLSNLSKDDLIQEGAIGLARAVDRWNPEFGGRFSTYAVYWIRAAVLRCIAERDEFVRIPEHVSAAIRKVSRTAKTLGLNIDESDYFMSPLWKEAKAAKELAVAAGLTEKQLIETMKVRDRRRNGVVSYESWMTSKKTNIVTTSILDNTDLETNTLRADTDYIKTELAKFLRPKEMEALSWRYGLNTNSNNSNEQQNKMDNVNSITPKQKKNYLRDAEMELFPVESSTNVHSSTTIASSKKQQQQQQQQQPIPSRGRWGEEMSFTEVGNKMQVSAEYGRRLCHAAITKLQRAAEDGSLELGLLY